MIDRIVHLLKNIWKRILLKTFFIAAILALVAGIFLERLHTPIWIYILIFTVLVVLAIWSDRWFIFCYTKLTKVPTFTVDNVDYSRLRQGGQICIQTEFCTKHDRKIKEINILVKHTSDLGEKLVKLDSKIKAGNCIERTIPININNQAFCNDAMGACYQHLALPLSISFNLLINPIFCGITIPENIIYLVEVSYDRSPDFIF